MTEPRQAAAPRAVAVTSSTTSFFDHALAELLPLLQLIAAADSHSCCAAYHSMLVTDLAQPCCLAGSNMCQSSSLTVLQRSSLQPLQLLQQLS